MIQAFEGLGRIPAGGRYGPFDSHAPGCRNSFTVENGQRHLKTVAVGALIAAMAETIVADDTGDTGITGFCVPTSRGRVSN